MITEDYVSLEVAKLLREKEFNEICEYEYGVPKVDGEYVLQRFFKPIKNSDLIDEAYTAPTLAVAMKWLREVHNYHICISIDSYVKPYNNEYYFFIRRRKDKFEEISPCEQVFFKTYEEAAEVAIKYCLEKLI